MGCCCRLLLALLLLPAGLGNGVTAASLIPTSPPFSSEGTAAGPSSRDVPTPTPGQPWLPTSTGPAGEEMSPGPAHGGGPNSTTAEAPSPAPATSTTGATITDGPPLAFKPSWVPPATDTARGTADPGAAPSPTALPAPSNPTDDLHSSPGVALSPPPALLSPAPTQPPSKEVPSLGTLAMAPSLAGEPTSPPVTVLSPTAAEAVATGKTTLSTGVTMEEVPRALSAGSIVAITVTVIVVVVLVFTVATYLKIRHSSYGRLLDDHDHGSWGNYNNPLYDDS